MEEDREEPREYDIDMFTVACTDAVLESLEELQLKVEEIQMSCEEYAKRNSELQQRLIDKENELVLTRTRLEDQITQLKKINLQILAQKFLKDTNMQKWVKFATDMVDKEQETHGLAAKIDQLSLKCMEKDKMISNLEWQLKDKEASLATATADRNRLATEVDELAIRLDELEFVEALHRQESIRSRQDGNFDSDDEPMTPKRGSTRIRSKNAEEDGNARLRRAANFTNINSLNLSSDFSLEKVISREASYALGQGDLSRSDNMLSKDICRSLNRIYEIREDTKYFSQSNSSIDRQTKLRSSLTERRRTGADPSDLVTIQMKTVEGRKPRVYVNGDYCEELKESNEVWYSPASRRKDVLKSNSKNLQHTEQSTARLPKNGQDQGTVERIAGQKVLESRSGGITFEEKTSPTLAEWDDRGRESDSQSDLKISMYE